MKRIQSTPPRYQVRIFLCLILGVFFIGLQSPMAASTSLAASGTASSVPEQAAVYRTAANSSTRNILLIGQDRRPGETGSRSDCMILCTLYPGHGKLTMTSFLRDLYVKIPGYQDNRLNAAYAFGGTALLRQTLQENFGIDMDGCVEVDFGQFSQLIDLLGGVTIELRQDEAKLLNDQALGEPLQAGCQRLSGDQALAYARIRSLDADGDFSRTSRQRKLILALLSRCKAASLPELVQLFREASPMLSTDIRRGQALSLIAELSPILSQMKIHSQQIPTDGTYAYRNIDGMSVLVADMEANRNFLESSLNSP